MSKDLSKLSKFLAVILRHNPEEFGLRLDEEGFTALDPVWKAIRAKYGNRYDEKDLLQVVDGDERGKKRYEIVYGQIRAMYGHFLLACLEKLRRGENAVVFSWQDRPVALVWLARDASVAARDAGFDVDLPPESALVTDSYLALDLRGSPRRETLLATLHTFLATEGVTAIYGIQDTRHAPPVLAQCGARLVPVARRLEVTLLAWKKWLHHRFKAVR